MKTKLQRKKKKGNQTTETNLQELVTSPSHFSFSITKIAVSQICQSVGFRGTQESAINALTQITGKYLQAAAKSAASYANNANRTQSNLFDVINGLHDLYSVQGFSDASILHNNNYSSFKSSILIDVANFVKFTDEIPFAKPIPRHDLFSVNPKPSSSTLTRYDRLILDSNSNLRCFHIPKWLPSFPDGNTYKKEEGKLLDRRKNGEELWENGSGVNPQRNNDDGRTRVSKAGEDEEKKSELRGERERVRFKIGRGEQRQRLKGAVGMVRNGICRGGKRVCCDGNGIVYRNNKILKVEEEEEEEEEEEDGKMNGYES